MNILKYESTTILGNGPSLSKLHFESIIDPIIIGCNWIFLHKNINQIDNRLIICFSDPFFLTADPDLWLNPLRNLKCKLLLPQTWLSTLNTSNSFEITFKNRLLTYNLLETEYKSNSGNEHFNLQNFPSVKSTSSVMTTVCLPYAKTITRYNINIYGVDKNYYQGKNSTSVFNPYFFKFDPKYGYKHTEAAAEEWSNNFSSEFSNQMTEISKLFTCKIC